MPAVCGMMPIIPYEETNAPLEDPSLGLPHTLGTFSVSKYLAIVKSMLPLVTDNHTHSLRCLEACLHGRL